MKYVGIILFLLFLLMLSNRGCESTPQVVNNSDSMANIVDKYKADIDSIKAEYLTLLNSRAKKTKILRDFRTKYVHDTITLDKLVGDTAKLEIILSENKLMQEILFDDSIVISNQEQVIIMQDSVISYLEAITANQIKEINQCTKEVAKLRKKANKWKAIAIIFGIVAAVK
jgi:uncharacterized protein YcfL